MIRAILFFSLCVLVSGCATLPRTMPPAASREVVTLQGFCRKHHIVCRWDGVSQAVNMTYGGKKISALVDSNIMIIDGKRIALSAPLRRRQGAIVVPDDFERIVIGPVAEKPRAVSLAGVSGGGLRKVIVDPGHGGKDPGAIGHQGIKEKTVTLDIARRLARNLKASGVQVVMTRDTDEFISLQKRTEVASQSGADLFISIHANAHKNRRTHGVEIYYAAPLSLQDKMDGQRRINEKKMFARLKMQPGNSDVRGIISDMLYTYRGSFSPGLSEKLACGVPREIGSEQRGSKPQRYYVLRNSLIPAVLVEVGFITNPTEAGLLRNQGYRQKIADAITRCVLRFADDAGM